MNIDANVQKILLSLLRRWKLLVIFALIGVIMGYFYTSHFTTLTYTSNVKFLAYAVDGSDDMGDINQSTSSNTKSSEYVRTSNTSKMNYAMKMLPTYVEIMNTNEFMTKVTNALNKKQNSNYSVGTIKNSIKIELIEETAIFTISVTTTNAELSYNIAQQLETSVPQMMKQTNSSLVHASVQDKAVKAASAGSLGYPLKCAIGAAIGIIIAALYVILRTLFDVRIKSSDELSDKYSIPVLGSIPNFSSSTPVKAQAQPALAEQMQKPLDQPQPSIKEKGEDK
jgi:capsular polysaccharide biosynthesis protein